MKLLIIGIDALDPFFLNEFADDLPTFGRLRRSCVYFRVRCDAKVPNSCAGWLSLYTGLLASQHGILDWGIGGEWLGLANKLSGRLLWEKCNASGYSVGLLNAPLVWPAYMENGWCVAGFPSPIHVLRQHLKSTEPFDGAEGLYSPPELATFAPEDYVVDAQDYADGFLTDDDRDSWYVPKILELAQKRTSLAITLTEKMPVDVTFVVYTVLDRLLHAYGYFLPHRQNRSEVEAGARAGYVLMDSLLNELLQQVPFDSLLVCGDHGLTFSTNAPTIKDLEGNQTVGDPYDLNHTWETVGFLHKRQLSQSGKAADRDLTWLYNTVKAWAFLDRPLEVEWDDGAPRRFPVFDPRDEEIVKRKLQGLGYL